MGLNVTDMIPDFQRCYTVRRDIERRALAFFLLQPQSPGILAGKVRRQLNLQSSLFQLPLQIIAAQQLDASMGGCRHVFQQYRSARRFL